MLDKTTIIVQAVELSEKDETTLWSFFPAERKAKFGIIDWNTDDGRNEIRFDGEDFYRVVIKPKAKSSKEVVVKELLKQLEEYELDVDLCCQIEGGYVDVVFGKFGWRVLVLNDSRGVFETKRQAIDFLHNSVNIFTH